jgi:selenium metabolism protein YedF
METLNCQGLTCPQPVVETRNFLAIRPEVTELVVLVDNEAAAQNVRRLLESQGFKVSLTWTDSEYQVRGQKEGGGSCKTAVEKILGKQQKTLIMISKDTLGQGDDGLGALLMLNFLRTLKEMEGSLWRLVFVNNGVKLTVEEAEALSVLQELESNKVSILVCGTCLNHFGLLEKKKVGETTNMLDIVTSLDVADKVITF